MFDHSLLHRFNGKYHSPTAPLLKNLIIVIINIVIINNINLILTFINIVIVIIITLLS